MKLIACPINGLRPAQEFLYGGEVREMPDPSTCSDVEWADYVFNRIGEPGIHTHDALDLRYGMCRALIPEACKNPCEEGATWRMR